MRFFIVKMGIILDTSFLVALNNVKDANHESAIKLKNKIKNNDYGQPYVSDYIFDEFVTFLRAKSFPKEKISQLGDSLISGKDIKILNLNKDLFLKSWNFFKKSNGASFTDCTIIISSKEHNINKIASYDEHFDRVNFLHRLVK
tara:strand:- start:1311 stop:1742 length:432 start_codon:yes stop_codon:yes gene_type:complete